MVTTLAHTMVMMDGYNGIINMMLFFVIKRKNNAHDLRTSIINKNARFVRNINIFSKHNPDKLQELNIKPKLKQIGPPYTFIIKCIQNDKD